MEDRFTDGVKNAWKFAASEAAKLGSDYIGTEHLLLGIAHEKDSAGGKILNSLGVTVDAVEQLLSQYSQGRSLFSTGEVYAAPRTKRVLEMAVEEANELGNSYVGTEHLLLAILHEGGGLAVRILESFGVTQDKLQKAFEKVLSEDSGKSDKSVNLGDLDGFAVDLNEKAKQGGQGKEKLSSCFCCGGDTGKSGSIRPLLIADADQIIQTDLIQLRQTDGNGDRQLPDAFFISGIHIAVAAEIVGNLADRQIVVRAQILQSLIFHDSSPLRKCY